MGERPDKTAIRLAAIAVLTLAGPAAAQLPGLPGGLGLPPLPSAPLDRIGQGVAGLTENLTPGRLADLRQLRIERLVRTNSRDIEVDAAGEPVVRGEILAVSPSAQSLAAALAAGFTVARQERLEGLDLTLVVLNPPPGLDAPAAVRRLRRADRQGTYEFNHLYFGAGMAAQPAARPAGPTGSGGAPVRIGLIDTGVDARHPALAGVSIEQRGFAGAVRPAAHGTAVASLAAGRAGGFRGAAPGAALYVADVYGAGRPGGSAEAVVRALDWMGQVRAPVVNISLVGPANTLLKAAIAGLARRGVLIVAAVGNDGPAAPPSYPASYDGVVAVTGVDARGRVLLEAGRASHVDFAAPGSDMAAADHAGGFAGVRGTSYAAPIVAGKLAALGAQGGRPALDALAAQAQDLGARGPDRVFGRGLVGADVRVAPDAVGAGR